MTRGLTATVTGGRAATTRRIPPQLALAVGMPSEPAPTGSRWVRLADVARLESGHTPSRRHPEWWGGAIPWLSLKDAKAHHGGRISETTEHTNELGIANSSARVLPADTVCLSRTASVGYVVIMDRPMATSQDFVSWVCSGDVEPAFLKYLFLAEGAGLLRFAAGAVHSTIYFPEVKAFHIALPPLPEQQRIVAIIDEAFEGIARAREDAEMNLRNTRALFESHLESVFSRRGDGWAEKPLRDVSRIGYGYTQSAATERIGPRFLRITDIRGGQVDWSMVPFCPIDSSDFPKYRLADGDIVFARTGATTGKSHLVTNPPDAVFASYLIRVQTNYEELLPEFLDLFFQTPSYWESVRSGTSGSAQGGFNATKLGELVVPFPRLVREQEDIAVMMGTLAEETRHLESIYQRKLVALDELKQSLLHQAFSGQL